MKVLIAIPKYIVNQETLAAYLVQEFMIAGEFVSLEWKIQYKKNLRPHYYKLIVSKIPQRYRKYIKILT